LDGERNHLTAGGTKYAPAESDPVDEPDVDSCRGEETNEPRNEDQGNHGIGEIIVVLDPEK